MGEWKGPTVTKPLAVPLFAAIVPLARLRALRDIKKPLYAVDASTCKAYCLRQQTPR